MNEIYEKIHATGIIPVIAIDDADKAAYHLYLKNENGIQAYLRVLPKGVRYEEVSIGRVISVKRRCGFATRLLNEAILVAKEKFGAKFFQRNFFLIIFVEIEHQF